VTGFFGGRRTPTLAETFGCLIERAELRQPIRWVGLFAWRDHANYVAGRHPVDVLTGTDVIASAIFLGTVT
jgi:hypothetical protein